MIQLTRKLKIKCIATGSNLPQRITPTEWYPVVGVTEFQYRDPKDEKKTKRSIKFIVINDDLKFQEIVEYNCQVMIDEEKVQESVKS